MNQILTSYEIATLRSQRWIATLPSVVRNDYVIFLFRSAYFLILTLSRTPRLFFNPDLVQNDYTIF